MLLHFRFVDRDAQARPRVGTDDAALLLDSEAFGNDILPRLPGRQRIYAYDFARNYIPGVLSHEERAYWRDVGTLDALREAQNDILGPEPVFSLSNAQWPIHGATRPLHVVPAGRGTTPERAGALALRLNPPRTETRPTVA